MTSLKEADLKGDCSVDASGTQIPDPDLAAVTRSAILPNRKAASQLKGGGPCLVHVGWLSSLGPRF